MPWRNRNATWSLTRRMAVRFATVTSIIVALYALGVGYFVFDQLRDSMKAMLADDADELAVGLLAVADDPVEIRHVVDEFARASERPPLAFRLRARDGTILQEAGPPELLAGVREKVSPRTSWRDHILESGIGVHAKRLERPDATLEVFVSTDEMFARLREYAVSALIAFILSIGLAAFAGYYTAHDGLRSLRDVVIQARDVHSPERAAPITLENAPDEIRAVGAALNDMLQRIQAGLQSMKTFTAGLAHELRSPLQNLIGETEVTLLTEREPESYRQLLRSNLDDLHELSDAVDNMVAYCRSQEPPAPELCAEEFDVARESEMRLQRELKRAERNGIQVALDARGNTRLRADREGCLRLLRNLVANAIDWSPRGGTVRVRVEGDDEKVRMVVEDEGSGVDSTLNEKIFQPFVSGTNTNGRRGGYGLGLTICKDVVDAHHGRLRFEPRAEGGTRFIAELPRRPPSAVPVPAPAAT